MDKNILLTVAIPTYNRSETLERIINQLRNEKANSFLILISDDNSPDNNKTEVIVRKYQKFMPNLIYHKNKSNLGYSGNVCKLYELAETRYIWFLCDDDSVVPGAIGKILQAIVKYEPVVAVFNHTWVDPYGRKSIAGPKNDIIYNDIKQLKDYDRFMRLTLLSTTVVEKRLSIEKIKNTNYQDNVYFQITLALLLLSDKFKFCEIASLILDRNVGYKYGDFFKFILIDELKAVSIIDHKFDNKKFIELPKKHFFEDFQLYFSQKLGLFKYNKKPTKETKKLILQYFGIYSIFLFSFPIIYFMTPAIIIKFLYLMKLFTIHGYTKGIKVYNMNINRANIDTRKTGFINYR